MSRATTVRFGSGAATVRRAVCVEALLDQTASRYGLPFRTRYVVAAFA